MITLIVDSTWNSRMGKKTNLTLYVDKNLVKEAKELGINLSAFLEIKLREYLALVKSREDVKACRGRDSNPGPTDYESVAPTS